MKIIRDSQMLIGMLEGGELNEEYSKKLRDTLKELDSMSQENPKTSFKGSVTMKLDIAVAGGMATINADITTKLPRRPRRSSVYWVTEAGGLSTEHPQQNDMFSGPRELGERARN